MSAQQGASLLQAVIDSPDPMHKLVYADWLEENDRLDEAYAFRWAAGRRLHPRLTPARRYASWQASRPGQRFRYAHDLPRIIIDAIDNRARHGLIQYKSLCDAFRALGYALRVLRDALILTAR
jgi:uncharacterized protein (TIGR02996 family)